MIVGDFVRWLRLPTKNFRRQWWGGCSMGPWIEKTKDGRITGLRTAKVDTERDQKGTMYARIKYDDDTADEMPFDCLRHDTERDRFSYSV